MHSLYLWLEMLDIYAIGKGLVLAKKRHKTGNGANSEEMDAIK